jgi:hypothetical protein
LKLAGKKGKGKEANGKIRANRKHRRERLAVVDAPPALHCSSSGLFPAPPTGASFLQVTDRQAGEKL